MKYEFGLEHFKSISNFTPYFTPKLSKWSDEQKINTLLYKCSNAFIFCSLLHFPLHFLSFGVKYGVMMEMLLFRTLF